MNIFSFANCQADAALSLLKTIGHFNIHHEHNYTYIEHTVLAPHIEYYLRNCDVFIYQPLSSKYPIYNTDNLKRYLKESCILISFPYIYNDAFTPLFKSKKLDIPENGEYSLVDKEIIVYSNKEPILNLKRKGLTLDKILELYDTNKIDFLYENRFNRSINILKEKERETRIKASDFILENFRKHMLFRYHSKEDYVFCNHLSDIFILYIANEILKILGYKEITHSGQEIIKGTMEVSRYDLSFYKYEWCNKESERAEKMTRNLIIEIYNNFE